MSGLSFGYEYDLTVSTSEPLPPGVLDAVRAAVADVMTEHGAELDWDVMERW
jgi:hypothetical protein